MDRTVIDALTDIQTRFTDPKRWTHFTNARNESGVQVAARAPQATCWCLDGAVMAATTNPATRNYARCRLGQAVLHLFPHRITASQVQYAHIDFNDHGSTTREDVMRVVDHAITLELGQGQGVPPDAHQA